MWIFLSDVMLSIVEKPDDTKAGTLTVRARIAGDIERVFPEAKVTEGGGTDYRFPANIPREKVAQAIHDQVMNLNYSNFKSSVRDTGQQDAYVGVWNFMYRYQEIQGQYEEDSITRQASREHLQWTINNRPPNGRPTMRWVAGHRPRRRQVTHDGVLGGRKPRHGIVRLLGRPRGLGTLKECFVLCDLRVDLGLAILTLRLLGRPRGLGTLKEC